MTMFLCNSFVKLIQIHLGWNMLTNTYTDTHQVHKCNTQLCQRDMQKDLQEEQEVGMKGREMLR